MYDICLTRIRNIQTPPVYHGVFYTFITLDKTLIIM